MASMARLTSNDVSRVELKQQTELWGDTTMWLYKKKCQQRIDKEGNIHTKKTSAMAKKIDKI